jgi:hypothetical protein
VINLYVQGKGKDTTNRSECPEEVEVQLYSFLSSALGGGGWSAPRSGRFTPGKDPVPIAQGAGWAPGPVWTCAKNLASTGIRSPDRSQSLHRLSYPGPFLMYKYYLQMVRMTENSPKFGVFWGEMLRFASCFMKRSSRPDQLASNGNYAKLDVAVALPNKVAGHNITTKLRLEIQKQASSNFERHTPTCIRCLSHRHTDTSHIITVSSLLQAQCILSRERFFAIEF